MSKQDWFQRIQVCRAIVNNVPRYYLIDENLDFLPHAKAYIDMQVAQYGPNVSPNTLRTYCYGLRYFYIYLSIQNRTLDSTDGDYDFMISYKLWLQNPYRFCDGVIILPGIHIDKKTSADYLSIPTLNQYISNISAFYNWLTATKIIKRSPVPYRLIPTPTFAQDRDMLAHTRRNSKMLVNALKSKVPKKRPKVILSEEFTSLYSATTSKRNRLMLLLLYDGGFRLNELLGIWIEDIDFGSSGIWVRFRAQNSNHARAKAGYGRDRFIALSKSLMSFVDEYIATDWLNSNTAENFLFVVTDSTTPSHNGNPWTDNAVHSLFQTLRKRTGLYVTPHMLRHTHATTFARHYIKNGEPVNWKVIAERLGHASVRTTMETYAHLSVQDYKSEYQRLFPDVVHSGREDDAL